MGLEGNKSDISEPGGTSSFISSSPSVRGLYVFWEVVWKDFCILSNDGEMNVMSIGGSYCDWRQLYLRLIFDGITERSFVREWLDSLWIKYAICSVFLRLITFRYLWWNSMLVKFSKYLKLLLPFVTSPLKSTDQFVTQSCNSPDSRLPTLITPRQTFPYARPTFKPCTANWNIHRRYFSINRQSANRRPLLTALPLH